jgi:nucleotide-binding universal stress UspA family protein
MFEKILVCLDGSKLAEQILPYVEAQALQFVSQVTLLQVVTVPSTAIAGVGPVPSSGEIIAEQFKIAEKDAEAYLKNIAQSLEAKGIEVEAVTLQGAQVGEGIVDYANKNGVELIAIATHGRSGLGRAVFGSVADYVLRQSGIPIMIVRPKHVEKQ